MDRKFLFVLLGCIVLACGLVVQIKSESRTAGPVAPMAPDLTRLDMPDVTRPDPPALMVASVGSGTQPDGRGLLADRLPRAVSAPILDTETLELVARRYGPVPGDRIARPEHYADIAVMGPASAVVGTPTPAAPDDACIGTVAVDLQHRGFVILSLHTPCHPLTPVEIVHLGLRFDIQTDAEGRVDVLAPVFTDRARFILHLPDMILAKEVTMPGARELERSVISWTGGAGDLALLIEWDGPLGVRSEGTAGVAPLLHLGGGTAEPARYAQVFTRQPGDPPARVSVAVPAGQHTCGRAVDAQLLYLGPEVQVAQDIILQAPRCRSSRDRIYGRLFRD